MPSWDVWSLGMETTYRSWMAFKSFSPLWSIFLPFNCRVGKRKRRIKNRFIIIIFPVCRHRSGTVSTRSLLLHFTCATTACYWQDLLYWLLCYSIISELFSIPAPYWWTGVAPYQQRIRYSYRSTPLIPVFSWGSSSILVWCIMLAGWHFIICLTLFLYIPSFLRDPNIKPQFPSWPHSYTCATFAYWHPELLTWHRFVSTCSLSLCSLLLIGYGFHLCPMLFCGDR